MLRTRLFISLVPFVVILLAIGIYAIILFSRITANVDLTVTGNYRSVMATEQMRLALSRMEEGVLIGLGGAKGLGPAVFEENSAGNKALGTAVFEQNRRVFETNLDLQLHNGKSLQESDLNRRLSNNYQAFREAGTRILLLNQLADQRRAFQLNFEPGLPTIDGLLDEIYQLNHHAILATTQNVERIMQGVTRWMVSGIVVALLLASYACYKLAQYILEPIQSLTRATHELGEGNLDQVVAVTSRDELGDLAQSFNKMAAQLRDYRQSTTEKIVRLHQTMEATLASFPDPIFVLNRSGEVELMNLAATQLAKALKLKNELPEHLQETALKTLRDGQSFLPHSFKEVVSFRLEAQEKFFLPRILAMRNEDHDLIGVSVVLYDVTRFRLLDDAKTNLVATVSHEIRTPLTSVRMVLHLLLEKAVGALTPRQNELLIAARDDSERLLRILNDLLDLTRLEQGNTGLRPESTAPSELVQNVADIMREAVMSKNLRLTCDIDPALPAVLVDRQRINHVFTNLVNNAIKYSPSGSEIVLQAKWSDDREVQFSVIDQGPGVPEDFQDHIFDRFFRVPDQTKTGAGLGLSIAREIVLAHGGRIGVRNRPHQGSEFYFLLAGVEEESATR